LGETVSTRQFLSPEGVSATCRRDRVLTIEVSGREGGIENVRIQSAGTMPVEFPIFMVEADENPVLGVMPYVVHEDFKVHRIADAIVVHSSTGSKRYPVQGMSSSLRHRA
jgi:hypothetical protein